MRFRLRLTWLSMDIRLRASIICCTDYPASTVFCISIKSTGLICVELFLVFHPVCSVNLQVYLCANPHCLDYSSCLISLDIEWSELAHFILFFLKIAVATLVLLPFHINFRIILLNLKNLPPHPTQLMGM